MKTQPQKINLQRVTIDAKDQPLGRLASKIALLLRKKNSPHFVFNQIPAVKVVVFNTDLIKIFPKKLKQKLYWRYSGFPGGLKLTPMEKIFTKDSRLVLKKAVFGMLPKNRLRAKLIKNLIMFTKEIKE